MEGVSYLIIGLILTFLLLTTIIYFLPLLSIDIELSREIQEHRNSFLTSLMYAVSYLGNGRIPFVLIGLATMIFFLAKEKREAIFILGSASVSIVNTGLKILINRHRPTSDLIQVLKDVQHQSFPSGHVSFYVSFLGFLVFLLLTQKYLKPILRYCISGTLLIFIITIPISRVYLGVHWFSDVIGGFILGLIFLLTVIRIYLKKSADPSPSDI